MLNGYLTSTWQESVCHLLEDKSLETSCQRICQFLCQKNILDLNSGLFKGFLLKIWGGMLVIGENRFLLWKNRMRRIEILFYIYIFTYSLFVYTQISAERIQLKNTYSYWSTQGYNMTINVWHVLVYNTKIVYSINYKETKSTQNWSYTKDSLPQHLTIFCTIWKI